MSVMQLNDLVFNTSGVPFGNTELAAVIDKMVDIKLWPNDNRVGSRIFLAGGAIRRTVMGQSIDGADLDFFFENEQAFNDFHMSMTNGEGNENVKVTERQFNNTYQNNVLGYEVQAIKFKWYESPDALLDEFDYTLCQFATDGDLCYTGAMTLWDVARKRVRPHKISMPVASLRRLLKYTNQGFYACNGALVELLNAARAADLEENRFHYID